MAVASSAPGLFSRPQQVSLFLFLSFLFFVLFLDSLFPVFIHLSTEENYHYRGSYVILANDGHDIYWKEGRKCFI